MSVGKVGKSKTSGGAIDYVLRKQKNAEEQPKIIGGNILGGNKQEIKTEFAEQEKLNFKVKNTTTHIIVSFPAEKIISDEDAADYADELIEDLGYDANPYLVVRHFDKAERKDKPYAHIHIVVSRINNDGTLIPEWKSAEKTIEAVKKLDEKFELESVAYDFDQTPENKKQRNIKKNEYQMMSETGKLSVMEQFRDSAENSLMKEKVYIQQFVQDLEDDGFEVLPNVSDTTGEMRGFSFSKDKIIFTASRAGKKFAWKQLARRVNFDSAKDKEFLKKQKLKVLAKKEADKLREKVLAKKEADKLREVLENEKTVERSAIGISNGSGSGIEFKEKSNPKKQISEVETAARNQSAAGLEEAWVDGEKSAEIRNDRADYAATRSRQEIAGNRKTSVAPDTKRREQNSGVAAEDERRTDNRSGNIEKHEGRGKDSKTPARRSEIEAGEYRAADNRPDSSANIGESQNAELSDLVERIQTADGERVEHQGNIGDRTSDSSQSEAKTRGKIADISVDKSERPNIDNPAPAQRSREVGDLEGETGGATSRMEEINFEIFKNSADANLTDNNLPLHDGQSNNSNITGSERANSSAKEGIGEFKSQKGGNETQSRGYDLSIETDLSAGGQIIQNVAGEAGENLPGRVQKNCNTAKIAAQLINVKLFGGNLDQKITKEWMGIIEKSDAAAFFSEIIKPKEENEETEIYENLLKQAEFIADKLELPKPKPQSRFEPRKLAEVLTRVEVENYEEVTGEIIGERTFALLVKKNELRANAPLSEDQIQEIEEISEGLLSSPNFRSNLEAKTFNALMHPQAIGFDEELIVETQDRVQINEAASRELATFVQIAYGGQGDKFTDDFNSHLANQIYEMPTPAIDIYNNFRQFEWQKTIENFAPTVNELAEQLKIEITPPTTDLQRNQRLAGFAAQQIIDTYERGNDSINNNIKDDLRNNFLKSAEREVSQKQEETIFSKTNKNLEPPEFSTALEASSYNLTKQSEDEKLKNAQVIVSYFEQEAEIKLQEQTEVKKLQLDREEMWL